MIPKKIHYCWFGKGKMPALAEKCLKSWKKYCPQYKIVCHNEENFDVTENRYAREAYEAGKWAFVSDYVRLKVLYEEGGIYLDTDVEKELFALRFLQYTIKDEIELMRITEQIKNTKRKIIKQMLEERKIEK